MAPDPIYKQIGALIKARRKSLKLKQDNLADMLRISRGSLANIETGRQSVLVHNLYRFAAALEWTHLDLLPPLPIDHLKTRHPKLPIPNNLNLKPKQKKQVENLFFQADTDPKPNKERINVKTTKR